MSENVTVPLVSYMSGERVVIGEATVTSKGEFVTADITDPENKLTLRLGPRNLVLDFSTYCSIDSDGVIPRETAATPKLLPGPIDVKSLTTIQEIKENDNGPTE